MKKYSCAMLAIFVCFCFSWTSFSYASASQTVFAPTWEETIEFVNQNLPLEGSLVAKSDGYVYVKVDDRYINELFPKLGLYEDGYRKPPYFRRPNSPGAHISVIYSDEHVIPKEELGKTFSFTPKNIVIVHPSRYVSYAILQVDSPELEKLRIKYGLKPKLQGHEFHITIAKKTTKKR